jgi:hypothetical protein
MCANAQSVLGQKGMIEMGVYLLPDKHSKSLARHGNPFRAFFMCANAQNAWEQRGMIETGVDGCLYLPFYKRPKYLARQRQSRFGPFFRLPLASTFSAASCQKNPTPG